MSKSSELVFESDKLEKRQKIKRFLIPAAVLLLVIAVIVVIAVLGGRNKPQILKGGEDTPYPYFWTENKDGSLTIRLPENGNGTYVWTPFSSVQSVASLRREEKGEEGYTVYTLTPEKVGRTLTEFVLKNGAPDADPEDQIFSINLVLTVEQAEQDLKISVLNGSSRAYPGLITGGEAEGFPYTIKASTNGDLYIRMKDSTTPPEGWSGESDGWYILPDNPVYESADPSETYEEEVPPAPFVWVNDWDCVTADSAVMQVISVNVDNGFVEASLRTGMEAGSCEVRLFSTMGGAALSLMLNVAEDGSVTVSSHVLERFEPAPLETVEAPSAWYENEESAGAGN